MILAATSKFELNLKVFFILASVFANIKPTQIYILEAFNT